MSDENNKVLLIDDDVELCQLVADYLDSNGYQVTTLHRGDTVEATLINDTPDAIILDLMLPGIDGLTICRNIRATFGGAIIMLTALDDDIDEVTGLEVGADDYLAKPVKPRVLLAHIRAQLRRLPQMKSASEPTCVSFNNNQVKIDTSKRQVTSAGQDVNFSSAEFDLLWLLAKNVGQVIHRDYLHEKIFRLPYDGIDRSIDLRVSRIRKKLKDNPKDPSIIKTVRNIGYLLTP
jgi:two-component system response regulator RstA